MLKVLQILVTAHALVGGAAILTGCGQKGPLYAPNTPESAGRATLTQTLKPLPTPAVTPATAPSKPPAPASAAMSVDTLSPEPSFAPSR